MQHFFRLLLGTLSVSLIPLAAHAAAVDPKVLDACPGYNAKNVYTSTQRLTADLVLAGQACNVFGTDLERLTLEVVYETDSRIHLKITDPSTPRYEVPATVLPRPFHNDSGSSKTSAIRFNFTTSPFSFSIYRASNNEILFSTASHPLIYEPQYLRLKTILPPNANIYGLGEHTDPFRLPTHNTTRTMWARDAFGVPTGTNLYGAHPVYFEQRMTGTHGVFLLNSNGMDVKINDTETGVTTLEYNVIGGVFDFYFLAGSETDPTEVARQYAEVVGTPAEVPYWSFGFHQCRYGYKDFVDVANVITNYSAAKIPLETMWTDIDYMFKRRIFTVDPNYFPLEKMREIVSYLHAHDQKYVLMIDPAIAYLPGQDYATYNRGKELGIWLKSANGSYSLGVVWPGVTVYPDWFHPNTQAYWSNEFSLFYNPKTGIDIDGAWIDMNEPASFCVDPCTDPFAQAVQQNLPPPRLTPPPDPNTPIFVNSSSKTPSSQSAVKRDFLNPKYVIENASGSLSNKTAYTDSKHFNGLVEYDTHNLYGTMMSVATREAMFSRRPGDRTLVITRSTFVGAGAYAGKWLGDTLSDWDHYRNSIAGMLGMASIYQVPMVGSDICGFAHDTTQMLCSRWAMLGAFYPFMRNHKDDISMSQEFYRWPGVAEAAKNVIDIRYRLLDYIYTAFHQAKIDGTPVLNPLWFKYPKDTATYAIDLQFFYGGSLLVSPVTDENSTSVTFYLPKDIFYDFQTLAPVQGLASSVTLANVNFAEIPLHIKGGVILPLRATGAMTTAQLRKTDFEFVVAPGTDGKASGTLYVDDGISIMPSSSTEVTMSFANGELKLNGKFGFKTGVNVGGVKFLGVPRPPRSVKINQKDVGPKDFTYDAARKVLGVSVGGPFDRDLTVAYL